MHELGKGVNIMMFKLLVLRYLTEIGGESFCSGPNHGFLVELPTQLSTTFREVNVLDVRAHFYFLMNSEGILKWEVRVCWLISL